ncbi:MAG: hypothetical protein HQ511_09440 [Rhodospirillales bacterium]|nr:hypothetical protein [Rhodospirillales bacterium]
MKNLTPPNPPIKQTVIVALKQAAFRIVPAALLYRLWHLNTRRRPRFLLGDLSSRREFPVQEGVQLHVGWADVPGVGSGPTASLYVHREEVLRLDCFGGDAGHMHLNPEQNKVHITHGSARVYFQPGDLEEQVDRAAFELVTNTRGALLTNKLARVRDFPLDPQNLSSAAQKMTDYMKGLIAERG